MTNVEWWMSLRSVILISHFAISSYLERTSCIGCGIPAAGDHSISRLPRLKDSGMQAQAEAAPTGGF